MKASQNREYDTMLGEFGGSFSDIDIEIIEHDDLQTNDRDLKTKSVNDKQKSELLSQKMIIIDSDDDEETAAMTMKTSKKITSKPVWEREQVGRWGPYRIPYIAHISNRLSKAEVYSLISSNKERAARIPQGCCRNAVFLTDCTK